jgi:hypothetical protein
MKEMQMSFKKEVTILPEEYENEKVSDVSESRYNLTSDKPLTSLEYKVCELYAEGASTKIISETLGAPVTTVKAILSRNHVKSVISEMVRDQYLTLKEGRLRVINKIIDDKIRKLEEETDGDMSSATKKDIVDLLVIADSMLKEREKAELGTTQDTYVQVIQQIMKD